MNPFHRLPLDLTVEICLKCNAQGLERLIGCAPIFTEVLRSFAFQKLFADRTSKLESENLLLVTGDSDSGRWEFHKTHLASRSTWVQSSTSLLSRNLSYSNGLIGSTEKGRFIVYNPTNGRSRLCPEFSVEKGLILKCLLGFQNSASTFKLLGFGVRRSWKCQDSVFKILTLEGDWNWRPLNCLIRHNPHTNSLCLADSLHYAAYLSNDKSTLITFDMKTEAFSSNPVPEPPKSGYVFLAESGPLLIRGKVGVAMAVTGDIHRIWVLDDVHTNAWSLLLVETPVALCPNHLISYMPHRLTLEGVGIIRNRGQDDSVVFSRSIEGPFHIYSYSPLTEQHEDFAFHSLFLKLCKYVFWDHVESIMFI